MILGKLNLQKWVPTNTEKIIAPESVVVHPDYEAFNSDADIAVIILSQDITFNKFVRPLCLWNGPTDLDKIVGKYMHYLVFIIIEFYPIYSSHLCNTVRYVL